ncbi:MAG TPA: hypothetical protein DCY94_04665 [Firmicutes bacterium]|nr:hypothetical protein [Bacillota bacterium]
MKNNSKNRRIVIAIILAAVVLITIGGTLAYFLTTAGRNEEQKLTIKTGNLALTFEDNDSGLTGNIMIGESREKLFILRNTGTEPVTTNMIWDGLVNTYLEESLSYTLEYKNAEDGEYQSLDTAHENVPQSDKADDFNLAKDITINLEDINQETDRTAILSTKFNLGDAVTELTPSQKTLAQLKLTAKEGNPDFASAATADETAEGLYSMEDDYGTSYYFRGAVSNNYVKFGGFFWRIIRINGDGSIRMQYDGTQAWPNANGGGGSGGTNRYTFTGKAWNTKNNDAKYVGWMFGGTDGTASTKKDVEATDTTEEAKETAATYNQTDSDLKELWVDPWYKTNIEDKGLSKYIGDEIFCNDRSTPGAEATGWSRDTGKGFGTNITAYGATSRIGSSWNKNASQPSFKCVQKNDAFTVNDKTKGNGNLTYPIGLITADEVVAAGSGKYEMTNQYYYLFKNTDCFYRTFTPSKFESVAAQYVIGLGATSSGVKWGGYLTSTGVNGSTYQTATVVVLNITPEYAATMVGEGSMTSPYQIPGVE